MPHTIAEIARLTGLEAEGDLSLTVRAPAEPAAAGPDDLALAMSADYADGLAAGGARAAVLWPGADRAALGLAAALYAPRARVALAELGEVFAPAPDILPGIHPTAVVDPSAEIGEDVWLGPFAVVGPDARVGPGARIAAHVTVGREAAVGAGAFLFPGVRVGARVSLGARVIVQANAVLGADGFSYVTPERGAVESAKETGTLAEDARNTALRRINALGTLLVGDDVEIGAGTAIDRGTVAPTTIGAGTKIDNLVQIGHNCRIGRTCLICGHVGIAGSVTVGDRVVLGGKTGIGDHLEIGADAVLAGGSLVGGDVPPRSIFMGVPAQPRESFFRQVRAMKRLPRVLADLREMRAKLGL